MPYDWFKNNSITRNAKIGFINSELNYCLGIDSFLEKGTGLILSVQIHRALNRVMQGIVAFH